MKQMLIFWVTGLFCLLLLGCGGDTAVSTPTPLAQLPTETASHTPSPSSTETTTPAPTATVTTTPTHTPSPTATPVKYEIPTWVADPNTNVILLESFLSSDIDTVTVSLFNAATGERFDLLTSEEFSHSRWVQQNGQLFISLNYPKSEGAITRDAYQALINIATGELTTPMSDTLPGQKVESPNGRYLARLVVVPGTRIFIITILDRETGEEVELTDPFEGSYGSGTEAKWSADSAYLAVNRYSFPEREVPPEYGLTIYLPTGEIFRQYEGLPTIMQWAPNASSQMLFWREDSDNRTPCILNVIEDSTECLETVAEWTRQQNVRVGFFSWSFDGTKVGFSHWNTETTNNGLCFINLLDEAIQCPVASNELQLEYPVYPYFHYGSPEGQYIALITNPGNPSGGVDPYFTWLTVDNSDGTNFRALDRVFIPSLSDEIWRPPIPINP
jgi:hypothetical protein